MKWGIFVAQRIFLEYSTFKTWKKVPFFSYLCQALVPDLPLTVPAAPAAAPAASGRLVAVGRVVAGPVAVSAIASGVLLLVPVGC